MSDLISREWLQTAIHNFFNGLNHTPTEEDIQRYIKVAPSVENKGEWIAYDHGMGLVYLKCPFCGATIDKRHVEHNFCGKCGAKLSGEKSGFKEQPQESEEE